MMDLSAYPVPVTEHTVRANGIDIWYVEAGEGIPLLLLHGDSGSNGPRWVNHRFGWGAYLDLFAKHFRVILPDTRGQGRTRNPAGVMNYPLFAQDYLALIETLGLDPPFIGGISGGGTIATVIGIMAPKAPRAIVDWAGYQMLNPDPNAWIYHATREILGGSPEATQLDYDGVVSKWEHIPVSIAEFEPVQGPGAVRTYFEHAFPYWTTPMEYTFADYPRITAPMLMLFGDRDNSCRLSEAHALFQQLPHGEFGVIPGTPHQLSPIGCQMVLDYLLRQSADIS
jgi:pimeloyl-ACP methyl ester carboxylesterase